MRVCECECVCVSVYVSKRENEREGEKDRGRKRNVCGYVRKMGMKIWCVRAFVSECMRESV